LLAPYAIAIRLLTACLIALALLTMAAPSGAAEREDYHLHLIGAAGCTSGQADQRGTLYLPCSGRVRMYNRAGRFIGSAGPSLGDVADVAPSPTGRFIYFGSTHREVGRLVRVGRRYRLDRNWHLHRFRYSGSIENAYASHIATDARGYIYVSDGGWTENLLNTALKFAPNGRFITSFGGFAEGDGNRRTADGRFLDDRLWHLGSFYWMLEGIAASPDGRTVYTTEVGNNRVTIWKQQRGGDYRAASSFGSTKVNDPRREGSCTGGMMAAPYDVGLDPWGYVYITNATCTQVQKFTANGRFVFSAFDGSNGMTTSGGTEANRQRSHSLAIDAMGNIWSGEVGHKLVRPLTSVPGATRPTAPEPIAPTPVAPPTGDTPVIQSVTVPPSSTSRTITVSVSASDNTAVTQMRMATEQGDDWTQWRPYQSSFPFTLRPGLGYHGVFVEVRDAAGNESQPVYAITNVTG
jgi:hypothetical protein